MLTKSYYANVEQLDWNAIKGNTILTRTTFAI